MINFQYGLQHLDVKPHNLFVVSNHVKVADFGLVQRLPRRTRPRRPAAAGGPTPLYASPETAARHPSAGTAISTAWPSSISSC